MIKSAYKTLAQSDVGQDRISVSHLGSEKVTAVLADGAGAGGVAGGGQAAQIVVDTLSKSRPADFGVLFDSFLELDAKLKFDPEAGLSTAVYIYVTGTEFMGAIVGDSDALLIKDGQLSNLASEKELLPLLGDGEACPVVFSGSLNGSVLLLCSDGLSKYIDANVVIGTCTRLDDPAAIVDELVAAIELPNGELQDDVSVIVMME